jgi:hypothetical protein
MLDDFLRLQQACADRSEGYVSQSVPSGIQAVITPTTQLSDELYAEIRRDASATHWTCSWIAADEQGQISPAQPLNGRASTLIPADRWPRTSLPGSGAHCGVDVHDRQSLPRTFRPKPVGSREISKLRTPLRRAVSRCRFNAIVCTTPSITFPTARVLADCAPLNPAGGSLPIHHHHRPDH